MTGDVIKADMFKDVKQLNLLFKSMKARLSTVTNGSGSAPDRTLDKIIRQLEKLDLELRGIDYDPR